MPLTEEGLVSIPGLYSRYVRLPSGARAHYTTAGESGPAVILLHGGILGSSGLAGWRFMAPYLAENGFRVYAPDFPGFGLTSGYEEAYDPGEGGHLDFLHEFVTALSLETFHIAGNSMGCMNTVNYVTAHPEKILSYALIAGGIGDLVSPMTDMAAMDTRPAAKRPDPFAFDGTPNSMKAMMGSIVLDATKITDDLTEMRTQAAIRHLDYYFNRHLAVLYEKLPERTRIRLSTKGRFDRLPIPGIYLYGTEDILFPHDIVGYQQEDALPKVQFFYPEKTGHQAQTDQPKLVNQLFLEFFRDGKVSWPTAQAAGISTRRDALPELVDVPS